METLEQIRDNNDRLRKNLTADARNKIRITDAVRFSPNLAEIIEAIKTFNDFTEANNPWGEHDFGTVLINQEKYHFKIDYYDLDWEYGQDPKEGECCRLLTIMHTSER